MVGASLALERPMVTHHLIKSLNAHAIAGLHAGAGEYRTGGISVGSYTPPEPGLVQRLMDDFVLEVERRWEDESSYTELAAYALWRINYIHPFVNCNGRTARALCYYIVCVKLQLWLPGLNIFPNRIRDHRADYYAALKQADAGNLQPLSVLVASVLDAQLTEG